jgi:hypothetical protein
MPLSNKMKIIYLTPGCHVLNQFISPVRSESRKSSLRRMFEDLKIDYWTREPMETLVFTNNGTNP